MMNPIPCDRLIMNWTLKCKVTFHCVLSTHNIFVRTAYGIAKCEDIIVNRIGAKPENDQCLNYFTVEIRFSSYCTNRNKKLYTKNGKVLRHKL